MNQLAAERRHEIGIRAALGARGGQVMGMVMKQGLVTVGIGVALGLGLALVLARIMAAQLYGISATDAVTFALTSVLVAALALVANLLPARRASRVDPVKALQAE